MVRGNLWLGVIGLVWLAFVAPAAAITLGTPVNVANEYVDTSDWGRGIASADFNGDGKADLVLSTGTDGELRLILGAAAPGASTLISNAYQIWDVVAQDIDGDGKADIAITTQSEEIVLFKGNGDGTFQAPQVIADWNFINQRVTRLRIADVNQDGRLDVIAQDPYEIFYCDITGYNACTNILVDNGSQYFYDVAVGDFNGDGKVDIAIVDGASSGGLCPIVKIYLGAAPGAFSFNADYGTSCAGTTEGRIQFADINGDGFQDFVLQTFDQIIVRLGNGTGGFGAATAIPLALGYSYKIQFLLTDLDADGKADLVTVDPTHQRFVIFPGTSAGLGSAQYINSTYDIYAVEIADTDADGALNIAVLYRNAGWANYGLYIYPVLNSPTPFSFTAQTGVAQSTAIDSNAVTISGLAAPASISIVGGQYSINGGAFTSTAGTISNGNTLKVRVVSANAASTNAQTVVTVSSYSATFTVTTAAAVTTVTTPPVYTPPLITTPAAFRFIDQIDVPFGAMVESNLITVSDINTQTDISVQGGEYRINGGSWQTAPGYVAAGMTVSVRALAGLSFFETTNVTLTIGGISDTFSVTTPRAVTSVVSVTTGVTTTSPTQIDPHKPINKLPTTRCAKTPTSGSTEYEYEGLALVPSGNAVVQTVPVLYGDSNLLAPGLVSGQLQVTVDSTNRVLLSIATCEQTDVGFIRSLLPFNLGLPDAGPEARIDATRLSDGRLKVAVSRGAVVYRGRNPKPTTALAPVAGFKPYTVRETLARNQFVAVLPDLTGTDVIVQAGEVAEFDANGRLYQIRIGSLYGEGMPQVSPDNLLRNPGDPVYWWTPPYAEPNIQVGDQVGLYDPQSGVTFSVLVPRLSTTLQRISPKRLDGHLVDAWALSTNRTLQLVAADPYNPVATWGLRWQDNAGYRDWLPIGAARIEPQRSDGVFATGYGLQQVVKQQVVVDFAPALPSVERFARRLQEAFHPQTTVEVAQSGVLRIRIPGAQGTTLALRSSGDHGTVNPVDLATCTRLSSAIYTCNGSMTYVEAGEVYTLSPAFVDFESLQDVLQAMGSNPSVTGFADGTVLVGNLNGRQNAVLVPDYNLVSGTGQAWWQGADGRLYIGNRDGSGQGFTVR